MREFVKSVHFIGIGGIGMSGIAEVLLDMEFKVSGSDLTDSAMLQKLKAAGATVYLYHDAANINDADAVVYSSAINAENIEYLAAQEAKKPLVPRAEMLGELMRFRKGIAISGTHGKTTTTSLVSAVLGHAGLDPTFVIGGVVSSSNTNARLGKGEYMVAEADESDASFLHLQPQMAVVTNIDKDHMETYDGSFDKLKQTYVDFLHNLPFYGLAILCFDDPDVREIAEQLRKPVTSYGFDEGVDYRAMNIIQTGRVSQFEVIRFGQSVGVFTVSMPGRHNVLNTLAAICIGYKLGLTAQSIGSALCQFQGINRRFEQYGQVQIKDKVVQLVDDYAHHPTEIAATLLAAQQCWPDNRLVVVFQPHRFTRTQDLFDDFACLLSTVKNLIITEVYAAGEEVISASDGRALCRAIRKRGLDPIFVESLEALQEMLPDILRPQDVLLTLGAGSIGRFSKSLAEGLLAESNPNEASVLC